MKVDDGGKITVEVRPDTLQKYKDHFFQIVNIRNVRGLALFFGFGEEKPFNLPGREVAVPRIRKNVAFFATNYAISAALVGVVTILLNPMFLFAMICLTGFWFYTSTAAASDPSGTIVVFGRPLSPEQRRLGMIAVSLAVVVIFGGSILFSICTASTALATAHAVLRDSPAIREEDELGFLSDEGAKIADTV